MAYGGDERRRSPSRLVLRKLYARLERCKSKEEREELEYTISILIDVIELKDKVDMIYAKIESLQ